MIKLNLEIMGYELIETCNTEHMFENYEMRNIRKEMAGRDIVITPVTKNEGESSGIWEVWERFGWSDM